VERLGPFESRPQPKAAPFTGARHLKFATTFLNGGLDPFPKASETAAFLSILMLWWLGCQAVIVAAIKKPSLLTPVINYYQNT